ncbi:MAG: TonB family protein [Bacteroidales bacterium]|nr:TonB family protein [Bacteroidales bacterium]
MRKEQLLSFWGFFYAVLLLTVTSSGKLSAQTYGYVQPVRSAVIYAGIPIPVTVQTDGRPEEVEVSVSEGSVEQDGDKYYLQVPDSMQGKLVTVTVMRKKTGKEIGFSKFRVYKVPNPHPCVGVWIRNGYHTADELLKYPKLRAVMWEGFPYDVKWSVISFRATVVSLGNVVADTICYGDTIPVTIQQAIRNAPGNSSVTFSNIIAHSVAGAKSAISDITVFIINPDDQEKCPETIAGGEFEPETAPMFPGGTEAMNAFLTKEIHYPEVARAHNIQGVVWVEFTIDSDGSISESKVATPLFPPCDEEALRAVMAMPKWIPGLYRGLPVRSTSRIPITFQMSH